MAASRVNGGNEVNSRILENKKVSGISTHGNKTIETVWKEEIYQQIFRVISRKRNPQ